MPLIDVSKFVEAARTYVGTPFAKHGRVKDVGIDCNGVLVCASNDAGVPVKDFFGYEHPADPEVLIRELLKLTDPVPRHDLGVGDVLVFCVIGGKPAHFAVATEIGMIHCDWGIGRVLENRIPMSWANRFYGGYRPRGFTVPTMPVKWPARGSEVAVVR